MTDQGTVVIEGVDHVGIRVRDLERALDFYGALGFTLRRKATNDRVAIVMNAAGVELNLVYNANAAETDRNILMDVPEKHAGYTHLALRVASIADTLAVLRARGIPVTQGPVSFGADGHVSVFVRDPDRNVVELRGRGETLAEIPGVKPYVPE
jgi:lactoylglutathione lyase